MFFLQCNVSNVELLPIAKTHQTPCKTRSLYRLQAHINLQNLAAGITFEGQGLPSISGANYRILKRRLKSSQFWVILIEQTSTYVDNLTQE